MAEETAEEKAKREAEEAAAAEAKAAEDAEAERKAKEKKPVTLESINERIDELCARFDELCARFDYFAELVLDSEAIDEVVEIEPPAPPAEEHHDAPATPAEGVKETVSAEHERPRRHKLT